MPPFSNRSSSGPVSRPEASPREPGAALDAPGQARGLRRLVTVREAAEIAAVSTRSIWTALARGDLEAVRLGARTTRIELSSIEAWIDRAKSRPAR